MIISRKSPITGTINVRDLDITDKQFDNWAVEGFTAQEAFPHLSSDDREFIISGLTIKDWETLED